MAAYREIPMSLDTGESSHQATVEEGRISLQPTFSQFADAEAAVAVRGGPCPPRRYRQRVLRQPTRERRVLASPSGSARRL